MTKYNVVYTYLFLADDYIKENEYEIDSVACNVLIRLYDEKGNEITFDKEEPELYFSNCIDHFNRDYFYLSDLLRCSFNRNSSNFITFEPNYTFLNEHNYDIDYQIVSFEKAIDNNGISEPKQILEKEYMNLVGNNIELFDNSTNISAQVPSYFMKEC